MIYTRDPEKNLRLQIHRGISFEEAFEEIRMWRVLDIIKNPKSHIYDSKEMFVISLYDYPHVVPFVQTDDEIILKTIYPDRMLKKKYGFID